jgi:TGF-beta propeptide
VLLRLGIPLLVALSFLPGAAQAGATVVLRPVADVGLPFWCSWGYDWDERCYTDDGSRLPVGGDEDKVWRAALKFPLAQVPPGSDVVEARLRLWFDGVCLAPRKASVACSSRAYALDVRRILSADWRAERELEFGEEIEATTDTKNAGVPHWLEWDVTGLVARWHGGEAPNDGLLLTLANGQEDVGVSGPYLPSMSYVDASRRPQLLVTIL